MDGYANEAESQTVRGSSWSVHTMTNINRPREPLAVVVVGSAGWQRVESNLGRRISSVEGGRKEVKACALRRCSSQEAGLQAL